MNRVSKRTEPRCEQWTLDEERLMCGVNRWRMDRMALRPRRWKGSAAKTAWMLLPCQGKLTTKGPSTCGPRSSPLADPLLRSYQILARFLASYSLLPATVSFPSLITSRLHELALFCAGFSPVHHHTSSVLFLSTLVTWHTPLPVSLANWDDFSPPEWFLPLQRYLASASKTFRQRGLSMRHCTKARAQQAGAYHLI